jgi:hypothetical protein
MTSPHTLPDSEQEEGKIILSLATYNQLVEDQRELRALHAGGVDNWDYYFDALEAAGLIDDA